jgi:hypothetical protein
MLAGATTNKLENVEADVIPATTSRTGHRHPFIRLIPHDQCNALSGHIPLVGSEYIVFFRTDCTASIFLNDNEVLLIAIQVDPFDSRGTRCKEFAIGLL